MSVLNAAAYCRELQTLRGALDELSRAHASLSDELAANELELEKAETDLSKMAAYSKQMSLISMADYRSSAYEGTANVHRGESAADYSSDPADTANSTDAAASDNDSAQAAELEQLLSALDAVSDNPDISGSGIDISSIASLQTDIIQHTAFVPELVPCDSTQLTSYFGYRSDPFTGVSKYHSGIDFAANYGDRIYASASGIVSSAGYSSGYGYYVIINHGNGVQTLYGHASSLCVKSGDTVIAGDTIAFVGSTGRSTGPHLHFEVLKNGTRCDPLDYVSVN